MLQSAKQGKLNFPLSPIAAQAESAADIQNCFLILMLFTCLHFVSRKMSSSPKLRVPVMASGHDVHHEAELMTSLVYHTHGMKIIWGPMHDSESKPTRSPLAAHHDPNCDTYSILLVSLEAG
jgi:hypothetical protein